MSGAEVVAILGLIASIISIIDGTKQVYDTAISAEGLPGAFREVADRLPIITNILGVTKQCIREGNVTEDSYQGVKQVIQACEEKAKKLEGLFLKLIPSKNASRRERYLSAVKTLGKGNEVEKLMKGILEDVQLLVGEHNMKVASCPQLEQVVTAISAIVAIPPSTLADKFGEPNFKAKHSGLGAHNNAQGERIAQGNAWQYISGSGSMHSDQRAINTADESVTDQECIQHLRITDPRDDKRRIEETKGGLLKDSYCWILENPDFQQWRSNKNKYLLWVKGDPGKGKTMLLCGIINELKKSIADSDLLSYFFCQATDSRISSATAVLRGLLFLLVDQRPSLVSYIQKKYNKAGKVLFEDVNAWVALSEIFTNILQDPSLNGTFLVIDALDECVQDMPKLLDFIIDKSSLSSHVKWIISSRSSPSIEESLNRAGNKVQLSLELNTKSISTAVGLYVQYKVLQLAQRKRYDQKTRDIVQTHLISNANDTFLWVALVCQDLENIPRWKTLTKLGTFPPGLDLLYEQMIERICKSDDADLCKQILALIAVVYRPITLKELTSLIRILEDMLDDLELLQAIVGLCGSLLTIREGFIYFVHQSVKDYLFEKVFDEIFPSGKAEVHHRIFSRSLEILSKTLHCNIYSLQVPGFSIDNIEQQNPDPLAAMQYSCVYWIDHLCASSSNARDNNLRDGGTVDCFIRKNYLYWLEALSLYRNMSDGVISMAKLEALVKQPRDTSMLIELVKDANRFIIYHKWAIEHNPLQAYVSALIFSPACSIIKCLFTKEEFNFVTITPTIGDKWGACLQTLEGHSDGISSAAFSHDSTCLATISEQETINIWDASNGKCLQTLQSNSGFTFSATFSHNSTWLALPLGDKTIQIWDRGSGRNQQILKGHDDLVTSVNFSHNSTCLASASLDKTIRVWDVSSGKCLQKLEGHSSWVWSVVFSYNSTWLASASNDTTVKFWDTRSGKCLKTLEGHNGPLWSIALSHNSALLASASENKTIKIWDTCSGNCLQTLEGHSAPVLSVDFSHDSTRLLSASHDKTIKIWDASRGMCLKTLIGHRSSIWTAAFSHDSRQLVSSSSDKTVKIWDASIDECLQKDEGHTGPVTSVAFSYNLPLLASASHDKTVIIWGINSRECLQILEGHEHIVWSVVFSDDSTWLASASEDQTVKIWDINSGECLQTFKGHSSSIRSVALAYKSTRLASATFDRTVKIWDTISGQCLQTLEGHSGPVLSVAFSQGLTRLASFSQDKTIKVWDENGDEYMQILGIDVKLRKISFDTTGLYLHTDIGTFAINPSISSNTTLHAIDPPDPICQGWAVSQDGAWITYNTERIVWLPSEYRPSCSVVSGEKIAIGVASGMVWIYHMDMQKLRLPTISKFNAYSQDF